MTQPLGKGKHNTGLLQRIGLNVNLHPKLKALSLINDTDTIGLKTKNT